MTEHEQLLQEYLDGDLTLERHARLEAWLCQDREHAKQFVRLVHVHRTLFDLLACAEGSGAIEVRAMPRARRWLAPLAMAAGLLLAAGSAWLFLKGARPHVGRAFVAKVAETRGQVWIHERVKVAELKPGSEVRNGTRIETGKKSSATLEYPGATAARAGIWASVQIAADSKFETRNSSLSYLETGNIAVSVAKDRPDTPFVVMTPQARIEVKGTRFSLTVAGTGNAPACPPDSREGAGRERGAWNNGTETPSGNSAFRLPHTAFGSTRLEVLEGLVGITRLSDGKRVDVAAGQYAVAADGVGLVALALSDSERRAAERTFAPPAPKKHQYGGVLFDDEFDGTLVNWDVVTCSMAGGGKKLQDTKVMGDSWPGVRIEKNFADIRKVREVLDSCVVLDSQRGAGRLVGIRSKMPIDAERFVVQVRYGFRTWKGTDRAGGETWVVMRGIEIDEDSVTQDTERMKERWEQADGMSQYFWEFVPAPEKGKGTLLCRVYGGQHGRTRDGQLSTGRPMFLRSCFVEPLSKRLFFGICGSHWDLVLDRVTVLEIPEDDVAEGKAR